MSRISRRTFAGLLPGLPGAVGAALGAPAAAAPLRVAVIGHTGRGDYGHGLDTMWSRVPGTALVAVADADPKGLAAAKKRLQLDRGFADYRAMLTAVQPDLVAVAPRYVDEHHDMILAAVNAGVRGIYVEKPFCRTPAEADAIVEACDRRGVRLAVAHRNRYHPVLPVARRFLAEGRIGRLLELRGRGKEDTRGGVLDLWVLGSHVMNLACQLAGAPVAVSATLLQGGRPVVPADLKAGDEGVGWVGGDELHARFEMGGGVPFFFDSVRGAGVRDNGFGLQIIGTEGVLQFRVDRDPLLHWQAGSPFQPVPSPRVWELISTAGPGKPEPDGELARRLADHLVAGADLVAAIKEQRAPLCDAREGRMTVEMICGVLAAHRSGTRVTFPLSGRGHPWAGW